MERIVDAANGVVFQPDDADEWQDRTQGMACANLAADLTDALGTDGRFWVCDTGGIPTAELVKLDDSLDWRDRLIWGTYYELASDTYRPGQNGDHQLDGATGTPFFGYLGAGAEETGTGAVTNGNPPVATGEGGTPESWRVRINGATNTIWLYVSKDDNSLNVYNGTVGAIVPVIVVHATSPLGKR
jgi:hypothetical protein